MLSLFKESQEPLNQTEASHYARQILVSSLNKGVIPNWDDFYQDLPVLGRAEDLEAIKENFMNLTTWSFLEPILNLEATEFFFHAHDKSQRLTLAGEKRDLSLFIDQKDWQLWLEIISLHFKQNWNVQNPFCSFYGEIFGKSFRLSLIHGSTSPSGQSKLMLRCLSKTSHPLLSYGDVEGLVELVKKKKNILVAGSTGSGKTSFLTSLLSATDQEEHLVILEDTYEIITEHPHQTRFLAGETAQTSLKSYLSYSLRLSPDRIILGEMRSHEVIPFLLAMNTGHKGLMGTLHASSAHDALHRVALLFSLYAGEANLAYEKVMELICRNLEYVVFMEDKKIKEVIKILGSDKGAAFFETMMGPKEGRSEFNLF